jgi:ubiquitin-conjugating enzyme E2 M
MQRRSLALLRLERELGEMGRRKEFSLERRGSGDPDVVEKLLFTLTPEEGPYQGQTYRFEISVGKKYPFFPPKARCLEEIFHPSIDQEGRVCMSITREEWSLQMGIEKVILGLILLMGSELSGEDPLNREAGELLEKNYEAFVGRVRLTYEKNQK